MSIVWVCGSSGGVGTSTLAALLALRLHPAVLVDASDGELDVLLGIENEVGMRWQDLSADVTHFAQWALPRWLDVEVLAGPPSPNPITTITALAREAIVVVDGGLQPAPVDVDVTLNVVVTRNDMCSVVRAVRTVGQTKGKLAVVTRTVRGASLGAAQVAQAVGSESVELWRQDGALPRSCEVGLGPQGGMTTKRLLGKLLRSMSRRRAIP